MNRLDIVYGSDPGQMCRELLPRTGMLDILNPDMTVCIKPNLVVAKPSASGATTDPRLVSAVIEFLRNNGMQNIIIAESSWVGEKTARAFKACGYEEISHRYGVPLVDLKRDQTVTLPAGGYDITVAKTLLDTGFLINMPVLKAHCQTRLTCALKNLKGCLPDSEKRRFHQLGLHEPIARLNTLIKTHLVIVDGLMGDLTFEEGGTPVQMDRIIAGRDPVLVDSYAARLIGYEPADIDYILWAEKLGVGSTDLNNAVITEINEKAGRRAGFTVSGKAQRLARFIEERNACSACYGSLMHALARLEEQGKLPNWRRKVQIGQGFRGAAGDIGIGLCTGECAYNLPGCPPAARDIVKFLEEIIHAPREGSW